MRIEKSQKSSHRKNRKIYFDSEELQVDSSGSSAPINIDQVELKLKGSDGDNKGHPKMLCKEGVSLSTLEWIEVHLLDALVVR